MIKLDPLNDGKSEVTFIDAMGDDLRVVNAARVSMHKESEYEVTDDGEVRLSDKDTKLVNYLAKHEHWTPFSHGMLTRRIQMPIFVARQWFKHQVGFTRNEVSRRYVDESPEFFLPSEWRSRPEGSIKQGSGDTLIRSEIIQSDLSIHTDSMTEAYRALIDIEGVAPEMARMILPQNMYTEFYETASLAGYARLCKLRLDHHAQKETAMFADAVHNIASSMFPVSWEALIT